MTNSLPRDSANITVNLPNPVIRILGRHLFQSEKSRSDFMREAMEEKLARECPEVAAQIEAAKQARRSELIRAGYCCIAAALVLFAYAKGADMRGRTRMGKRNEVELMEEA